MELLSIVVPGLFAAAVAIAITVAIERLGGVLGGLLGTLPTTIIPASWGIFAESTPEGFACAMFAVPPGMFISAFFLWTWRALPLRLQSGSLHRRLVIVAVVSLTFWLAAALLWVSGVSALHLSTSAQGMVGVASLTLLVMVGAIATRTPPGAPPPPRPVPLRVLLLRGVAAGVAVACAVLLAQRGDALAAGVASVFPAIFLTTMLSLWLAQGEAVPAAAAGPMMLGSASVATFALVATVTFPHWGAPLGALAAWLCAAFGVTLPAVVWLRRRHRGA